jgi:hypothetical protein
MTHEKSLRDYLRRVLTWHEAHVDGKAVLVRRQLGCWADH